MALQDLERGDGFALIDPHGDLVRRLIVCWPCFKYRDDIVPFKYFDGTFEEWLERV